MWDLILEYGMPTVSWYAEFAFRSRVSMSASGIGHRHGLEAFLTVGFPCFQGTCGVLVLGCYQLDLVMPGSSPRCAIVRKQIRHRLNLR
jgi:hypothetical protein